MIPPHRRRPRPGTGTGPRYALVAEQVLQLIADYGLRPGDRMSIE